MSWKCQIYALAALALMSSGFLRADDQNSADQLPSGDEIYQPAVSYTHLTLPTTPYV